MKKIIYAIVALALSASAVRAETIESLREKVIAAPVAVPSFDAEKSVTPPVVDSEKIPAAPPARDVASAKNVQKLVRYISLHAAYDNNFEEDIALGNLLRVGKITNIQLKLLKTIFLNADYNNNFTEDAAFLNVLLNPGLTAEHERVLVALILGCSYDNDFDEDAAFLSVVGSPEISSSTAKQLIQIYNNAQYNNNIDDTELFLAVLNQKSR